MRLFIIGLISTYVLRERSNFINYMVLKTQRILFALPPPTPQLGFNNHKTDYVGF